MKVCEILWKTTVPIFFRRLIHKIREVRAETHTYKYEVNFTIYLGVGEHCFDFFGIVMKVREVLWKTTVLIFFRRLIHKVREVRAKTHTYKYEVNITIYLSVGEHCLDFFGIVMKVREVLWKTTVPIFLEG